MSEAKTKTDQNNVATKKDIKQLENKFDKKFEQVDQRFEQIDKRFEGVEKRLTTLENGQKDLLRRYFSLEDKIDANHNQLNQRFDQLFTLLDGHAKKIQDLETERISATARMDRHDKQLIEHDRRFERLETAQAA